MTTTNAELIAEARELHPAFAPNQALIEALADALEATEKEQGYRISVLEGALTHIRQIGSSGTVFNAWAKVLDIAAAALSNPEEAS